jgi:carboxyl-terminal processing protease
LRIRALVSFAAGLALLVGACAGPGQPPAGFGGHVFARGLDDIAELYIEPVSSRRLGLAAAARLARLDSDLTVGDGAATGAGGSLALAYGGRNIGFFATPGETDSRGWGELLVSLIAAAKHASPRVAQMPQEAIDSAMFDGMVGALDRFSHYSAPSVARDQRAARDGFGGIGITLDGTNDKFHVVSVSPQGPAERAGIRPEDEIVAIDGATIAGRGHEEIVHRLRGPVGSAVAISLRRGGAAQAHELRLQRALVLVPTVTVTRDGEIAVVRVVSFNRSTTRRIAEGLAEIRQQTGGRLAGIVLDLRSNPGGLLDQAVSLSDLFMSDGPIVSTTGRHPASQQYFAASGRGPAPRIPLTVLVNGRSASAAEIVAAALQDAGRAVVIGSSSYGKGSVQTVVHLPNEGELTLTWARLVAPSGYQLQSHGVVPTLCTADIGDDERALELSVRLAAAAPQGVAARPRATLDEGAWAELRRRCPPRGATPALDVKLAERVIADPRLYGAALQAVPAATHVAAMPDPALTGVDRALSSRTH